jgi:stalled ribosome alternative rescue factor ArfA
LDYATLFLDQERKHQEMNKKTFKMTPEELEYIMGRLRKGGPHKSKKGKGSYTRKEKHKNLSENT